MPALNGPSPTLPGLSTYQVGDGNTSGVQLGVQGAPATYTAEATITAAELATGILSFTGSADTITLPTVALWETYLGGADNIKVNASFDFSVIATTGNCTLAVGTGWTLVGGGDGVTAATQATLWRARKTAAGAWTVYRIGGG